MEQEMVDIAFRFVECINRRDLEGLTAVMSTDHLFVDIAGDLSQGRDTMRRGWEAYFSAYPDYMIHISEFFLRGDTVILVGRTTGSHLDLPRAVEFQDYPVIWVAHVREESVSEWRLYEATPENRERLQIPAPLSE